MREPRHACGEAPELGEFFFHFQDGEFGGEFALCADVFEVVLLMVSWRGWYGTLYDLDELRDEPDEYQNVGDVEHGVEHCEPSATGRTAVDERIEARQQERDKGNGFKKDRKENERPGDAQAVEQEVESRCAFGVYVSNCGGEFCCNGCTDILTEDHGCGDGEGDHAVYCKRHGQCHGCGR